MKKQIKILSIFICLASMAACKKLSPVIGKWRFDYIQDMDGNQVKPVSEGDEMNIKDDGTFDYKLSKAGLEAKGTWKLVNEGKSIEYTYTLPAENVRTYELSFPDKTHMVFFENNVNYAFKK